MARVTGRILAVQVSPLRADVVEVLASPDRVVLDTVQGFLDEGRVRLGGSEVLTYTSIDRATATLYLEAAPSGSYAEGDLAEPWPLVEEWWAHVRIGDGVVSALVPHELRAVLPLGVRDEQGGGGEAATVDLDSLRVIDVEDSSPTIDGGLIDPDTLPVPPLTDGDPPSTSPTPTVLGGVGYLAIRWASIANADPVTYDVHLSTQDGFSPDASTLAGSVAGTLLFVRRLPPDDDPLEYGVTYYARVVARDEDGSAAASGQGSGQMVQINNPDVATESITAAQIVSGTITTEQMAAVLAVIGRIVAGVEGGQRVELDADGLRLVAPDGSTRVSLPTASGADASFSGSVVAQDLTIIDRLRIHGTDDVVESSAILTVASGPGAPTSAPTLTEHWDTLAVEEPWNPRRGLTYDSGSSSWWYVEHMLGGRVVEISASTGDEIRSLAMSSVEEPLGAVRLGSHVFVLFWRLITTESTVTYPKKGPGGENYTVTTTTSSKELRLRKLAQSDLSTVTTVTIADTRMQSPLATPGIGTDGSDLLVVGFNRTDAIYSPRVLKVNPSTLAEGPAVQCDGPEFRLGKFTSIVAAESGWWITAFSASLSSYPAQPWRCRKYSTSGAYQANRDFALGPGEPMHGTGYDGTRFWTLLESEALAKHTTWDWTTESGTYWVGHSWASASYETPVGQLASIAHGRRAGLRISVTSGIPSGGPDRIKLYMNRGSSPPTGGSPTRFAGFLQAEGSAGQTLFTLTSFDNAGTPPENPAASNFPASPAKIQSAGGEWKLWGDGATEGIRGAKVDIFTADGSWSKPSGAKVVEVICIGGGGGGGSGRRGSSGGAYGGGGGGGGNWTWRRLQASLIDDEVAVTVGAGGSGGAARTTDNTDGQAGQAGGTSSFGGYLDAAGGNAGSGGTAAASSGGAAKSHTAGNEGDVEQLGRLGGSGGQLSGTVGNGITQSLAFDQRGGAGGGGGGGGHSTSPGAGGNGGAYLGVSGGTGSGALSNTPGGNGTAHGLRPGSAGGGGGSGNASTPGSTGGDGGRGAGGGGGGGSVNGANSGAGGAGGPGIVAVITYF